MKKVRPGYVYLIIMFLFIGLLLPVGSVQASGSEADMTSQFKDVTSDNANLAYITYLKARGIINGFPDGGFHPGEGLTRAQAAVIISKAGNLNTAANSSTGFKDVDAGHWAKKYITAAFEAGYLEGFPDGTYQPEAELTRAQAISLILRLSNEKDSGVALPRLSDMTESHWAARSLAMAIDAGMVTVQGGNIMPDKAISREDISRALAILLTVDPQLSGCKLTSTLTVKNGEVTLSHANSTSERVKDSVPVGVGDTIKTGNYSSAVIEYPDGSSLLLEANSILTIKESDGRAYIKKDGQPGIAVDNLEVELKIGKLFGGLSSLVSPDTPATDETVSININRSKLLASVGSRYELLAAAGGEMPWYKATNKQKVKVKVDMPWGVAAIRGSFWQSAVNSNGSGSTNLLEGSAQVIAGGQTVSLSPGQASGGSTDGGPPSAPAPMTAQQAAEWTQVQSWVTETAATMTNNQGAPPAGQAPSETPGTPTPDPVSSLNQALNEAMNQVEETAASAPRSSSSGGSNNSGNTVDYGALTTVGFEYNNLFSGYDTPVALSMYDSADLWTNSDLISIKVAVYGSYANATDTTGNIVAAITPTLIDETSIEFSLGAALPVGQYVFILLKNGVPVAKAPLDVLQTTVVDPPVVDAPTLALGNHYSLPVPGSATGTIKLSNLSLSELTNAVKWQVKTGTGAFAIPALNSVVTDAVDYTMGSDISATPGQHLLLLAVDSTNQVKGFADVVIAVNMVQNGVGAIATGWSTSYAIRPDGNIWGWGWNASGQVGNGYITDQLAPAIITNKVGSGVVFMDGGSGTGYAVKQNGSLVAWGNNSLGQLGNNESMNSMVPVTVTGLNNVVSVASWWSTAYAIKSDGTVWAWGENNYGQIPGITGTIQMAPVQISVLQNVSAICCVPSAGVTDANAFVLKTDGTVWGWGNNTFGQLGSGVSSSKSDQPVQVSGLADIIDISCNGGTLFALKSDGTVWALGRNDYGQFGDGSTTNRSIPVQVAGLTGIKDIAAGDCCGYALDSNGTVWSWGWNGSSGILGNGTTTERHVPGQVLNLTGIVAIDGGRDSGHALKSDGTIWGWGSNGNGELGNGTTTEALTPVPVIIPYIPTTPYFPVTPQY